MPDWEALLSAASRLQALVPGAVLVGGTAAAVFARHRFSRDADHVVIDLRQRFDDVLADLEQAAGWKTARVRRPVLILGSLDGVETGVRQLIREAPLETMELELEGVKVVAPTINEILRIKCALILKRNATRDYIDAAAISATMGLGDAARALASFDSLYPQPGGQSALQQLVVQLGSPHPYDLDAVDLSQYRSLAEPWRDWANVEKQCAELAAKLFETLPAKP
jgi:hypothetical protein